MQKIIRQSFVFMILVLFVSCSNFHGRIEERILSPNDTAKTIFLINTSTNEKYSFTIKETSITDQGEKTFTDNFYELEPGQEIELGEDFTYSPQQYKNEYKIISFDTLKEIIDYDKKIKTEQKPSKDEEYWAKNPILKNLRLLSEKTSYYKNDQEITPFDYMNYISNDSKLIDSTKKGNVEIITYRCPVKSINKQIPLPRIKTSYTFEITGQVLNK